MFRIRRGGVPRSAPCLEPFDEAAYLAAHDDVREAVASGRLASGAAHYEAFGRDEGRALHPADNAPAFDEAAYLQAHPDIRAAVRNGLFASGAAHYAAFGKQEGRALRLRELTTIAELDAEILRLRALWPQSDIEFRRARAGICFREDCASLPSDPLSPAYRDAQLSLYSLISGRPEYVAETAEVGPIDLAAFTDPTPYPFCCKNGALVGGHLIELGHVFQALWREKPGAGLTVLEYGCGTGFATTMLAAAGYRVTAVDINPNLLEVVDAIAANRRLPIRTFHGQFGDVPVEGERFDIILFYEAFHHCLGFPELLRTLHARLAPGGLLVLAGEPIYPDFPKPWGLRLDGPSIWETRSHGWLELGFREDFLLGLMDATGWRVTKVTMPPPATDLFLARDRSAS